PGTRPPDHHPPPGTGPPGTGPPGSPPGNGPPRHPLTLKTPLIPITRGPCDHAHGQVGYHPARTLVHLVRARNATCTAPGCGRPAARCDLDHTTAWDQGGVTCECNLAPLCRHHHRAKQAQGWRLEQPEPGVLKWRTPSGRIYATSPTRYLL
ncbi:MAG TPA: HNH endonuclease signature motif containing protein, partial [Streptosporangiaceae bacterium]|nr:HNH endonuclease signature motif containing protein [Streptosporangiaceae bacterium]